MIYGDLNASVASLPPCLCSTSPGRLSCSVSVVGHIEKCITLILHPKKEGQGHPSRVCLLVWMLYMHVLRLCWQESCISFCFNSQIGAVLKYILSVWSGASHHLVATLARKCQSHKVTVKASALDLPEASALMLELVITSGKRQKNVTCQLWWLEPQHLHQHWPHSCDCILTRVTIFIHQTNWLS